MLRLTDCPCDTGVPSENGLYYICEDCERITAKRLPCPRTGEIIQPGTCIVPLDKPGFLGATHKPCPDCKGWGSLIEGIDF